MIGMEAKERPGPIPATFGFHIATYILCDLAEKPIPNPLPIKNRRKLYERLLRDLLVRESRIAGEDVGYVHHITIPHSLS